MRSSKSPAKQTLNQLIKGCHLVIHNAVLLMNENSALCTANQRQQCKCLKPILFILQKGILTVQKGLVCTQSIENIENEGEEQSVNEPKCCVSSKCSLCSSLKHTVYTCAQHYNNN